MKPTRSVTTTSIRTTAAALQTSPDQTVRLRLTTAHKIHVRIMGPVQMGSTPSDVIAQMASLDTDVKQMWMNACPCPVDMEGLVWME